MKDVKNVENRKYVLPEDAAIRICEDLSEKECCSFACSESRCKCRHTAVKPVSKEALSFAETTLFGVEEELRDNPIADLYESLDNNLEAANETIIAAHLNSFVWDVLYNIYFPDMNVTAEYAADLIQKRVLETVRKALAELYEADGDA
jgi:hypothetical protein